MKMAIMRENEAAVRAILKKIGIEPIRSEDRKDQKLLSLILPNLTEEQIDKFEKCVPIEMFAFRGHVVG